MPPAWSFNLLNALMNILNSLTPTSLALLTPTPRSSLLFAPRMLITPGENCQPSMLMGPLHTQEAFSVLSPFYLIFLEPQISSSHHLSQALATVPEIPVLPLALLFSVDNCSSVSVKKQKLSCEKPFHFE